MAISASPSWKASSAPHMTFRGKQVLVWSLNNYLGLANHPEVRKVDADAAAGMGHGLPHGRPHDERTDQVP